MSTPPKQPLVSYPPPSLPYSLERVDRNGETYPGRSPGRRINCRVHADDAADAVQQRAPAVAGINRSVRLDDVGNGTPAGGFHFPPQPGNDTHRQSVVQTERVSYSQRQLADLSTKKKKPETRVGVYRVSL